MVVCGHTSPLCEIDLRVSVYSATCALPHQGSSSQTVARFAPAVPQLSLIRPGCSLLPARGLASTRSIAVTYPLCLPLLGDFFSSLSQPPGRNRNHPAAKRMKNQTIAMASMSEPPVRVPLCGHRIDSNAIGGYSLRIE